MSCDKCNSDVYICNIIGHITVKDKNGYTRNLELCKICLIEYTTIIKNWLVEVEA
jgi:hypothetical protein